MTDPSKTTDPNIPDPTIQDAPPNAKQDAPGNAEKPVEDWVTGDEPMTGAQASYLKTLSEEAHETFDPDLTKGQASQRIDELQQKTGRGS